MLLLFTDIAQININLSLKMLLSLKWQCLYLFFGDLIDANKQKEEYKEGIFFPLSTAPESPHGSVHPC